MFVNSAGDTIMTFRVGSYVPNSSTHGINTPVTDLPSHEFHVKFLDSTVADQCASNEISFNDPAEIASGHDPSRHLSYDILNQSESANAQPLYVYPLLITGTVSECKLETLMEYCDPSIEVAPASTMDGTVDTASTDY
jgi:hypothetical protein